MSGEQLGLTKQPEQQTPMGLIAQLANDPTTSVETLRAMFELETDYQEREAKKDLNVAMVRFQQLCPIIDKTDDANGKKYARMERIWSVIQPIMSECGLAATWERSQISDSGDRVIVAGTLLHSSGHSKELYGEIYLPEQIKGQNKAQVSGSAITYARRYCTCGALGVQTGKDTDGTIEMQSSVAITEEQALQLDQLCDAVGGTARADMMAWAGVSDTSSFPLSKFSQAISGLHKRKAAAE